MPSITDATPPENSTNNGIRAMAASTWGLAFTRSTERPSGTCKASTLKSCDAVARSPLEYQVSCMVRSARRKNMWRDVPSLFSAPPVIHVANDEPLPHAQRPVTS